MGMNMADEPDELERRMQALHDEYSAINHINVSIGFKMSGESATVEINDECPLGEFLTYVLQCLTDKPPACFDNDTVREVRSNFPLGDVYRESDLITVITGDPSLDDQYEQRKKLLTLAPLECEARFGDEYFTGEKLAEGYRGRDNVETYIKKQAAEQPTLLDHMRAAINSGHAKNWILRLEDKDMRMDLNSALDMDVPLRNLVSDGSTIGVYRPPGVDSRPFSNDRIIFGLRQTVEQEATKRFVQYLMSRE